jgi:hypothetical protein
LWSYRCCACHTIVGDADYSGVWGVGQSVYAYVGGNPTTLTDPSGLQEIFFGQGWMEWMLDAFGPTKNQPVIPPEQPLPPFWSPEWTTRFSEGEGQNYLDPRWSDPNGGEWRFAPEDEWHDPHWDYNPWDEWNSPWQNVNPTAPPIMFNSTSGSTLPNSPVAVNSNGNQCLK